MRRLGRLVLQGVLILLIRAYQLILSPLLQPSCRFMPSCSHYAHEAVCRHGPLAGSYLAVRRLLRCHPFGAWGADPVPDRFTWRRGR